MASVSTTVPAVLQAVGLAAGYVAAVYWHPATRTMEPSKRNAPRVVLYRCSAVSLYAAAVGYAMLRSVAADASSRPSPLSLLCGGDAAAATMPRLARRAWDGVALTGVLFLGRIANLFLDHLRECHYTARHRVYVAERALPLGAVVKETIVEVLRYPIDNNIIAAVASDRAAAAVTLRDLVVGPVTEEVVLRFGVLALLEQRCRQLPAADKSSTIFSHLLSSHPHPAAAAVTSSLSSSLSSSWVYRVDLWTCGSPRRTTVVTSLVFAATHLHHVLRYYRIRRQHGAKPRRRAVVEALAMTGVDMLVTGVFGLLAVTVLRQSKGALAAAIASHTLCNYLGAPSLSYLSEDRGSIAVGGRGGQAYSTRTICLERVFISACYITGVVLFAKRVL